MLVTWSKTSVARVLIIEGTGGTDAGISTIDFKDVVRIDRVDGGSNTRLWFTADDSVKIDHNFNQVESFYRSVSKREWQQ